MDLFKNVIDISSEYGKILDFYNFVEYIHKTIGCLKEECNIKFFSNLLKLLSLIQIILTTTKKKFSLSNV